MFYYFLFKSCLLGKVGINVRKHETTVNQKWRNGGKPRKPRLKQVEPWWDQGETWACCPGGHSQGGWGVVVNWLAFQPPSRCGPSLSKCPLCVEGCSSRSFFPTDPLIHKLLPDSVYLHLPDGRGHVWVGQLKLLTLHSLWSTTVSSIFARSATIVSELQRNTFTSVDLLESETMKSSSVNTLFLF